MAPEFTSKLAREYETLYKSMQIRMEHQGRARAAAKRILAGKRSYESMEHQLGVAWYFTGIVHMLESDCSWATHLHNGDSLLKRTIQVPSGRPVAGSPPFSWQESAMDALRMHACHKWRDWSVMGVLFQLEKYNGWGYRLYHPQVPSPYLWSGSTHYSGGKYLTDGQFSDGAVSRQIGGAVLLRLLLEK